MNWKNIISWIAIILCLFLIGKVIYDYKQPEKIDYDAREDSLRTEILRYENIIRENNIFVDSVIKMKLFTDSIVISKEQEIIKLKKKYEKKNSWVDNSSVDSIYLFITEYLSEYPEREP